MGRSSITTNPEAAQLIRDRALRVQENKSTKAIDNAIAKALAGSKWDTYVPEEAK